jgi:hypothetical protein
VVRANTNTLQMKSDVCYLILFILLLYSVIYLSPQVISRKREFIGMVYRDNLPINPTDLIDHQCDQGKDCSIFIHKMTQKLRICL